MKTLVLVFLVLLGTGFGLLPAAASAQGDGQGNPPIEPLIATVQGTKFSWNPTYPVVPSRKAKGDRTFQIQAAISGTDVAKIVLHDFDTLEFKPGGGEGGGLGKFSKAPEQYVVRVDDVPVAEIELVDGDQKNILLQKTGHGTDPHEVLVFTVKLVDAEGNTIAEFVDPWDFQP